MKLKEVNFPGELEDLTLNGIRKAICSCIGKEVLISDFHFGKIFGKMRGERDFFTYLLEVPEGFVSLAQHDLYRLYLVD